MSFTFVGLASTLYLGLPSINVIQTQNMLEGSTKPSPEKNTEEDHSISDNSLTSVTW